MVIGQSGQSGQNVTLCVVEESDRGTELVLHPLLKMVDETVRACPSRDRAATASPAPQTLEHKQVSVSYTCSGCLIFLEFFYLKILFEHFQFDHSFSLKFHL